nr:hypothetical protein [Succinivibrionaceae bacterium]
METSRNLKRETLEDLLEGKFISMETDADEFRYLSAEGTVEDLGSVLREFGRSIRKTRTGSAFYLVWESLWTAEQRSVRSEFREFRNTLRPVVDFLLLVMNASQSDVPLRSGDTISVSDLAVRIEDNPPQRKKLEEIATLLGVRRETVSERTAGVLDELAKEGLTVLRNRDAQVYLVTGKIDYFYEVLDYIDSREKITEEAAESADSGEEDIFS